MSARFAPIKWKAAVAELAVSPEFYIEDIAEIVCVQFKQVSQNRLLLRVSTDNLDVRGGLLCAFQNGDTEQLYRAAAVNRRLARRARLGSMCVIEICRQFTLCELSTSLASLTGFLSFQSKAQQQILEPGIAAQRVEHRVHFDLHDRVRMLRIHLLEQLERPLFLACARISDQ